MIRITQEHLRDWINVFIFNILDQYDSSFE